ncbi:hypothetical protein A9R01_06750 ['Osedax' symbiont bacterium Rs2_46_30_T18]|mgnify:CR=1 FL=1|nr:hypothetical protein A9R01_06750 ['Osedax' symbiont bacterium Rs2_46_30_T18]
MSDQSMRYYERELAYVRKSLGEFSNLHPQEASHLQINRNSVEDPNISRLIEGMALLTAKTEQRLDQQLPELVQDLLSILYPGLIEVVPSYFPLRLQPDLATMKENTQLPASSLVQVQLEDESYCQFSTVCDLNIYPYYLADVSAQAAPFSILPPLDVKGAEAVIQLQLNCADPKASFKQMQLGDFEFYVNGFQGDSQILVELLLEQTVNITVSDTLGKRHAAVSLSAMQNRVTESGFQWLAKYDNHFSGYDLLRDYFSYADKSAYFKITGLGEQLQSFNENQLLLNIYVEKLPAEFLRMFQRQVFSLYTVPAINRFMQSAEPLSYDASALAMPVIGDADAQSIVEVISVAAVYEINAYGQSKLPELYKNRYADDITKRQWLSRTKWNIEGDREVEISVTLAEAELQRENITLAMDLWCGNGRTACLIAAHSTVESLSTIDLPGELLVAAVPSAPQYPDLDDSIYWRFISLLNANFISLMQSDQPEKSLCDILSLCNQGRECPQISSIKKVSYQPKVATIQVCEQPIFTTGSQINVTLDRQLLAGKHSVFSEVLNVFFQQFCSYDRFVQLELKHFGDDSYIKRFDAVHGSQACL